MAETRLVPPKLAAELNDELSRLRAARAINPKHGTRAGSPRCDDRCQVCMAETQLDFLISQVPRSTPTLGVDLVEPWIVYRD